MLMKELKDYCFCWQACPLTDFGEVILGIPENPHSTALSTTPQSLMLLHHHATRHAAQHPHRSAPQEGRREGVQVTQEEEEEDRRRHQDPQEEAPRRLTCSRSGAQTGSLYCSLA